MLRKIGRLRLACLRSVLISYFPSCVKLGPDKSWHAAQIRTVKSCLIILLFTQYWIINHLRFLNLEIKNKIRRIFHSNINTNQTSNANSRNEPPHDKTNNVVCAPSEDSDQPGHLIRVFAVRMKKHLVLIYPLSAQQRLWSDWADPQADLSLRWAHMPRCWFWHVADHIMSFLLESFGSGKYGLL